LAPPKVFVLAVARGLLIEPGPGLKCPGRTAGPEVSAPAARFADFCPAFAFAR
jgi:hypothetical protein